MHGPKILTKNFWIRNDGDKGEGNLMACIIGRMNFCMGICLYYKQINGFSFECKHMDSSSQMQSI